MKSGNLNFLEPSGPLQACNGTALLLPIFRFVSPFVLPFKMHTCSYFVRFVPDAVLQSLRER
jgi:hypothetical protein